MNSAQIWILLSFFLLCFIDGRIKCDALVVGNGLNRFMLEEMFLADGFGTMSTLTFSTCKQFSTRATDRLRRVQHFEPANSIP